MQTEQEVAAPLGNSRKPRRPYLLIGWIILIVAATIFAGMTVRPEITGLSVPYGQAKLQNVPLTARLNGKEMYTLYPGGEFTAGKQDGLMILLNDPSAALRGRSLSATAVSGATGEQIRIIDGMVIEDASGYGGKTRIGISGFGVPYAGQWRIEVKLDEVSFGQVVMNVPEHPWVVSPIFTYRNSQLRGTDELIGLTDPGIQAGRRSRVIWYIWGAPELLKGGVRIVAVSKDSGKRIDVLRADALNNTYNGTVTYFPALLLLPDPGLWRLTVLVNGRVFESVVVEAQ